MIPPLTRLSHLYITPVGWVAAALASSTAFLFLGPPSPVHPFYYSIPRQA